jgi:tetratricopeptide (TPR) repeat protein
MGNPSKLDRKIYPRGKNIMWGVEITDLLVDVVRVRLAPGGGNAEGSFGSGRLIAPGLVITARHVLESLKGAPLPDTGWEVRFLDVLPRGTKEENTNKPFNAQVIWRGKEDIDLALLRLDDQLDRSPKWTCFGQLTGTHLVAVRVAGFPEVLWNAEHKPEAYCFPANLYVSNPLLPYRLSIDQADAPLLREKWRGLSGAGVLAWEQGEACLLGVVQDVPGGFSSMSLSVARLSDAWGDSDFRAVLNSCTANHQVHRLISVHPPEISRPPEAIAALVQALTSLVSAPEALSGIIRGLTPSDRPSSPNIQGKIVSQVIERLAHPDRSTARVRSIVSVCVNLVVQAFSEINDPGGLESFLNIGSELTSAGLLEEMRRLRSVHESTERRSELARAEAQLCFVTLDFEAAHAAAICAVTEFPDDFETLRIAGLACMRVSKFQEARQYYYRRVAGLKRTTGCDLVDLADAVIDLAGACDQMFLLEESHDLLIEALETLEMTDERRSMKCKSVALNNLGGTLLGLDAPDEAKTVLAQAVHARQTHGETSFELAISLINLAEAERLLNDPYSALSHLERARQIIINSYGATERRLSLPPHILLAKIQNEIGTLRTIDFQDAEGGVTDLQKAIEIYQSNGLTIFNYDFMLTTHNLGVALQNSKKYDEALYNVRRASAACRQILPPDHPVRLAIEEDESDLIHMQRPSRNLLQ